MKVVHKGFDGLDVSFQSRISDDLTEMLTDAQEEAARTHQPVLLELDQVKMHVADTGAKGGYAFRCDTGPDGETWFFKKPNPRDPWGIRVSVKSLSLALYGLGGVRARLIDFMDAIDAPYPDGAESIGRVDYCIDILMPNFQLIPENFVMHSNSTRTDNHEMEVYGKSGKTTGVRIGKMPGRQVAIYDKRADIIAKQKKEWWEIWNANLKAENLPPLNPEDKYNSQVWRVELRAGKKHLKEKWQVRRWCDLDDKLGDVFLHTLEAIRYCIPGMDLNRSRWELDNVWRLVTEELRGDLFEMSCNAEVNAIKEIIREQYKEMLQNQILGLIAGLTAAEVDTTSHINTDLPIKVMRDIEKQLIYSKTNFFEKIEKAKCRTIFIQ